MTAVLLALLPDAVTIGIGVSMARAIPAPAWAALDRLAFHVLFPALIFQAAAARVPRLEDLLVMGGGACAITLMGFVLGLALRPLAKGRFVDFAGAWQTSYRFNSALGLAVVQVLPGEAPALMTVAIAVGVPLSNLLAVSALSRGSAATPREIGLALVSNPLLIASLSGLFTGIMGISLPGVLDETLTGLAAAAVPLALLSVGASLDWRTLAGTGRFAVALCFVKLLVLPGTVLLVARLLGLAPDATAVLTLFAALPAATVSQVLASAYGAERALVSGAIARSTLLACLTVPLWLALAA
jgi:malonate transporter and related proteins